MQTNEIRDLLHLVTFEHHPTLSFIISGRDWDEPEYLQLNDHSLNLTFSNGRKWRLSKWMTKSEIVQTAFMAYLTWIEHEARESFKYKGASIFGPHYDVDALVEIAGRIEVRG